MAFMIAVHGTIDGDVLDRIESAVAGHRNLGDVLSRGKPEDVITQDEYTHDVIMRFEDGVYLVYDVT